MSTNASSPASSLLILPMNIQVYRCFNGTAGTAAIAAFSLVSMVFLLPLYIFILYLGLKQWRRASAPTSHIDFLAYTAVLVELLSVLGSSLISLGLLSALSDLVYLGINLLNMQLFGQMTCHILTCLEHYLAVVHPIVYRGLQNSKCIGIRNVASGCGALLCFSALGLHYSDQALLTFLILFSSTFVSFFAITFCSLSVLCVLLRPGPARATVDGSRRQVDQSRLRAFNSIFAILLVMLVKLVGQIVGICLYAADPRETSLKCNLWISALWISLPSAVLLPVLYLRRTNPRR